MTIVRVPKDFSVRAILPTTPALEPTPTSRAGNMLIDIETEWRLRALEGQVQVWQSPNQGVWNPNTVYQQGQVVTYNGGTYQCLVNGAVGGIPQPNILTATDYGFESGVGNWLQVSGTIAQDTTVSYSGNASLKITSGSTGAAYAAAGTQGVYQAVPGLWYQAYSFILAGAAGRQGDCHGVTFNAALAQVDNPGQHPVAINATTWTQVTGTAFQAGATAQWITVYAGLAAATPGIANTETTWVDNVNLYILFPNPANWLLMSQADETIRIITSALINVPPWANSANIVCVAGGGSGGAGGSAAATQLQVGGGGGGAGGYTTGFLSSLGASANVVIGAGGTGGTGGAAGGNPGVAGTGGGSTSVTSGGNTIQTAGGRFGTFSGASTTTAVSGGGMGGNLVGNAFINTNVGMGDGGQSAGGTGTGGYPLGFSGGGGGGGGVATTTLGGGAGNCGTALIGGAAGGSGTSGTSAGLAGTNAPANTGAGGGGGGGGAAGTGTGGNGGNGGSGYALITWRMQ